jgi:TonB family protein
MRQSRVVRNHPAAYNLRATLIPAVKESTLNRSFTITLCSTVLCAAAVCASPVPASGQLSTDIETLAARTAERVTKIHQPHILVAGLQGCQLDTQVCTSFEASLRSNLEKAVPDVRFVKRENVINILEGRAFIALDVYMPDVLKAVATSAGADILVTDTLQWQVDGYELTSEVFDAVQGKRLDQFRAKIPRTAPDSAGEPLVFTDPESRISFIIFRGKQPNPPHVQYPACERCPDPMYTSAARADRLQGRVLLLVTVTENGTPEQVGVIDGLADGLTDQALETVRSWHFKPAIGKDGKPFATRVPIEVTFRIKAGFP